MSVGDPFIKTAAAPLLRVEDLRTEFRVRGRTVHAVNGVSYQLEPGQTLGLVGESGSGKSVSALSVLRLVPEPPGRIVGGRVLYQGRDLLRMDRPAMEHVRGREIAMVFQDATTALNPVLTIGWQIEETLRLHFGLVGARAQRRVIELLEHVGIPDAANRLSSYPHQFSGGMRQRVMIAMAIACEPKVLIADEPTSALDVTIQAQILDLIRRLQDEMGMAVLMITHDLGVVAETCDHVAVMYGGYVVEHAPVGELFARPRHPYTLGLIESIPRIDKDPEGQLQSIEGAPPELDDLPTGCPFAPRCRFARTVCWNAMPALEMIGPDHRLRCFVDTTTGLLR